MSEMILEGRGLHKRYGDVAAVNGVDIEIRVGERVGLVGESGSGKSTLGRLLVRLEDVDAGNVRWNGEDITTRRSRALLPFRRAAQVVFQDPASALHPRLDVMALVAEGLIIHGLHTGRHEARVRELLAEVGLDEGVMHRRPHELSGGQKQRVGIARALAVEPRFLLLDEPVSALDVSIQAQIVNLLMRLAQERQLTQLFVAHDLHVVRHLCERVCVMFKGRIVEEGPTEVVFAAPSHPYTKDLWEAVPVADPSRRRRALPVVNEADVVNGGCRYRARCPEAMPRCAEEPPVLVKVGLVGDGERRVACHAR
jgi:oligopeptide/dipeptide ABC transporter ATP-binding protein